MRNMNDLLRIVCSYLNKKKMEYAIIGGIAVLAHGIPRTTMDLDIIVQVDQAAIDGFVLHLKKKGFFADAEDARDALRERTHFTAQDKRSGLRVDIKGVYNEMDRRTMMRRMVVRHNGLKMSVETPEDLITAKLVYGSDQDIRDAEGVFLRQKGRLDMKYLAAACRANGVARELAAMVKRVGRYKEQGSGN